MKLTFIIADYESPRSDVMYGGFTSVVPKRSVTIPLTDEQVKMLEIKCVGKRDGKDIYEEIHDIFVEGLK